MDEADADWRISGWKTSTDSPVQSPGLQELTCSVSWPDVVQRYKATKPVLVYVLYLSMHYTVLLLIRTPFYVLLVFVAMYSLFCFFSG